MGEDHKRIVLCMDGTWNSADRKKERADGSKVLKPSNPLKTARAVLPRDPESGIDQVIWYHAGVGSLGKYPGPSNRVLGFVDGKLGGAWGAGFEANIERALTFLVSNHRPGDRVFVFGFSRGASQARGLTRLIDWIGGVPTPRDAYFIPLLFQHYLATGGRGQPREVVTSSGRGLSESVVPVRIEMLGVWDTVMALGSRFKAEAKTTGEERSFHTGDRPAACVRHARQALAIDESRDDFRPEIWQGHATDQTLEQRWFSGSHSNVGGGYVKDGLANLAYRWMIAQAQALGLAFDDAVTKHYRPHPQAKLYGSRTALYSVLESIRFRRGKGIRSLLGHPPEAHLTVDPAVIHRLRAYPTDHPDVDTYRPPNLLDYLAAQDDLEAFIEGLGLAPSEPLLPHDVLAAIRARRQR